MLGIKAMSSADQRRKWDEGEPTECDSSAWDRLPPLVRAKPDMARERAIVSDVMIPPSPDDRLDEGNK